MSTTPHQAFTSFLKMVETPKAMLRSDLEELLDLLDAFLINPERHRDHVRQIVGAYSAVQFGRQTGLRWLFTSPVGTLMPRWGKHQIDRLNGLKDKLLSDLQPGEFEVDILPSRPLVTHEAWLASYDCHLIEIRVAIEPAAGLLPERVGLKLTLGEDANGAARFIDCFPSTEFADVGEVEIGLTKEAKFTRGAKGEISLDAALPVPQLKTGVKVGASSSYEEGSSKVYKANYKYSAKIAKLVSSAVGRTVRWTILRAGDEPPTGGLTFLATLMTRRGETSLRASGALDVELENWGSLSVPIDHEVILLKRAEQAQVQPPASG